MYGRPLSNTIYMVYKPLRPLTYRIVCIKDAINAGDVNPQSIGHIYIMPSSFIGGQCHMMHHYQDTIAICHVHMEPNWPESVMSFCLDNIQKIERIL